MAFLPAPDDPESNQTSLLAQPDEDERYSAAPRARAFDTTVRDGDSD
jgi:hypothetical protein